MKKQIVSLAVSCVLLPVALWLFQEQADALSGEIVSFVFAFSSAVAFGATGYFWGYQKGKGKRVQRQSLQSPEHRKGSVPA